MGLGKASSLTPVVDSLKVEGIRPGCLVLKDHLEKGKEMSVSVHPSIHSSFQNHLL